MSDNVPDVIGRIDRDLRCIYVNPAVERSTGLPASAFLGRTLMEWPLEPPVVERFTEIVRGIFESGKRAMYLFDYPTREGPRAFEARGVPERDESGAVVTVLGIVRDLTSLRRAQAEREEVERAAERLRRLQTVTAGLGAATSRPEIARVILEQGVAAVGAAAGSLVVVGAEGKTLEIVGAVGYTPELVERWRSFSLDSPVPIAAAVREGRPFWIESAEDLAAFPVTAQRQYLGTMIALPLVAADGRGIGAIGLSFPAFVRTRSEDRELMATMAQQCAQALERAALLESLEKERARLAEADVRKDEFLAVLGHELRNPLAPIRNAVELLRRSSGDARLVEWACDVMERQMHQLTRLVDDLMDVSRIARGKVKLEREVVPLSEIVTRAVESSRPLVETRRQLLHVTLPPDPVAVDVDPARISQALANLLNNAAKYTELDGRIWLAAEVDGPELIVTVRDNGIGIPKEVLPKVFDLFAQGEVDSGQGGLGIGLTVVKRLVEMHQGSVEVSSEGPGKGSEFRLRLPVVRQEEPHPRSKSEERPRAGTSRRVLVVEDNRDAADSLVMFLELSGYNVAHAHDGPSAIEAARTFHPDVVLLDVGLPGMDGYEVGKRLREKPGGDRVMLVALTGYGQEEDRRRSSAAGFDHHLVKPVNVETLLELLASSVKSRRRL